MGSKGMGRRAERGGAMVVLDVVAGLVSVAARRHGRCAERPGAERPAGAVLPAQALLVAGGVR